MEENPGSHEAEKTEKKSGSVLLTYFQGDISSMVDEHFNRALSKATKPKEERAKTRRNRKSSQISGTSQWETQPQGDFQPMFASEQLQLGTTSNSQLNPHGSLTHPSTSAALWAGGSRPDTSQALMPLVYPSAVPTDGFVLAEHQYTNSLLNLLHNDRPDLGSVVVGSAKPDLLTGWTKYPGFGNQMGCDVSPSSGVQVIEKKNIYWY